MKKLKTEEGITLISLSVTIIVLVILAGVTISYVVGDNGFIKQAQGIETNAIAAEQEAQEQINALKSEEKYTEDGVKTIQDTNNPTINSFETIVTANSITININVTDAESGVATIQYSKDGGTTWESSVSSSTAKTYTFTGLTSNTSYNISVLVKDNEGNSSTMSKTVVTSAS